MLHYVLCICYFCQPLVKFKSHLYYEEKDHVAEAEKQLKPLKGSKVCNRTNCIISVPCS